MACCSACKIGSMGKKKRHAKVGAFNTDTLLDDILETAIPGVGMILAHEAKGLDFVKKMALNADGTANTNYPWIVNGVGIAAAIALPMFFDGDPTTKKYAKELGKGVAAQCIYSLYLTKAKTPPAPMVNKRWNSYALGKEKTYALGCVKDAQGNLVYQMENAANPTSQQVDPTVRNQQPLRKTQQQVEKKVDVRSMAPMRMISGGGF